MVINGKQTSKFFQNCIFQKWRQNHCFDANTKNRNSPPTILCQRFQLLIFSIIRNKCIDIYENAGIENAQGIG